MPRNTVPRDTVPRHPSTTGRLAGALAAAGLTAAALGAAAVPSAAAATGNLLTNSTFAQPGTEGAVPTGWTPTDLGTETAPYHTTALGTYDAAATKYAPPSGQPGGNTAGNFAVEDYYSAGSSTGVEGYGGAQALTGPVASSGGDLLLSWSTAQTYAPNPSVSAWAGSMLEVDLTSGGASYVLRYVNPFTPTTSTYSLSPVASATATTKYVVEAALTSGTWYVQPTVDVSSDIAKLFGLTTFSVTGVTFGDLEDTTSAASPYPNETAYFDDLSLTQVTPPSSVPEAPFAYALPAGGIVLGEASSSYGARVAVA